MEATSLFPNTCQHCKQEFAGKRKHVLYCSERCRNQAFREQKKQAFSKDATQRNATDATQRNATDVKAPIVQEKRLLAIPSGLAPDATFIVTELTRQRDKLERKVEEYEKRIETLQKENNVLEKDLDKAVSEMNAKPSALGALFSDTDKLTSIAQAVPGILTGFAEMIRASKQSATAIEGPTPEGQPQAQHQHPVIAWYNSQSEDVRKAFNGMVEYFATLRPNQVIDVISYTNRNSMSYKNRAQ